MDDRYRTSVSQATANNGLIVNACWKETITNDFLAILLFSLSFLRIINLIALVVAALFAGASVLALIREFSAVEPRADWMPLLGSLALLSLPAVLFFVIPRIDKTARRLLPNQFVNVLTFLVSSQGFVLVAPVREPLFLPWSSIVRCATHHELDAFHMTIEYRTADGQIATLNLDPDEYGDIFDILNARFGERAHGTNE